MAFTLQTLNDQHITVDADMAVIGRDPTCNIVADDNRLQPRHAVIKKVAGKWMVQSEGEWLLRVGNGVLGRKCWLNPGDTIWLAEGGPAFIFSPPQPTGLPAVPQALVPAATRNRPEVATGIPPALPLAIPSREPLVAQESNVPELRRAGMEFYKAARTTTASGLANLFRKHPRAVWGTIGGVAVIVLCVILVETPLGRWMPFLGSGSIVSSVDNDHVITESTGLIVCGYHDNNARWNKGRDSRNDGNGFCRLIRWIHSHKQACR